MNTSDVRKRYRFILKMVHSLLLMGEY